MRSDWPLSLIFQLQVQRIQHELLTVRGGSQVPEVQHWKLCSGCHRRLPQSQFYARTDRPGHWFRQCKTCSHRMNFLARRRRERYLTEGR